MSRRPPTSTLFPYTTLSDLPPSPVSASRPAASGRAPGRRPRANRGQKCAGTGAGARAEYLRLRTAARSEEHTSELQSRQYLVCRLLLEKKKTTNPNQQEATQ